MPSPTKQKPRVFNPLETLKDFAIDTAKSSARQVAETLSPFKMAEKSLGLESEPTNPDKTQLEKMQEKKNNHTPLDMKSLGDTYKKKDDQQLKALAATLFRKVTSDTEKVQMENKQKAAQEKHDEEQAKEDKKRKAQQESMHAPAESHGKAKVGLGQARPKAKTDTMENKVNSGK